VRPCGPWLALALLFLLLPFLSGCSAPLHAVIFDLNGLQKEVVGVRTDRGDFIEIMDGLAFRKIRLNKISRLYISPRETMSRDGYLYYQTELWLNDGTKSLAYILPDGKRSSSYVNINTSLLATSSGGPYAIKLKDVKEVHFLIPQKKKKK
jgi:hypothetical protein